MRKRRVGGSVMSLTKRNGKTRDQGFTLIELSVAILVLGLGAIVTTRAGDEAQNALGGMETRVLARVVAQNRAEELSLFGAVAKLPNTVKMGGQTFVVDVRTEATLGGLAKATIVARGQTGPGARLVAYVPQFGTPP